MSLEDNIFMSALEAQGIKRTKAMYEVATLPHRCRMCDEVTQPTYRLKPEMDLEFNTPYMFICEDCFKELSDE